MRKRNKITYFAAGALALAVAASGVGCGKRETTDSFAGYPIKGENRLTYWCGLNSSVAVSADTLGETPYAKKLQEETGVEITFMHPTKLMETEELNLLLASGTLPDIIQYDWYHTAGGPESAIAGGYIRSLNELIAESAPNLQAYLQAHPEVDKMVKTDEGHYYVFPFIRDDESLCVYEGLMLRGDWLTELGLAVPETVQEWTTVLRAFRDQKGVTVPFAAKDLSVFAGGFGIGAGYYLEDGQMKYGPMQEEYAAYLQTMRQWYAEGLIDKNLATVSNDEMMEWMRSGKSGATYGMLGSTLGRLNAERQSTDASFSLTAAPFPAAVKGTVPQFGDRASVYTSQGSAAITTACKAPQVAARFLDYGYSEAGRELNNFGIENESFVERDGQKEYTETILQNPNGLSMGEALALYARSSYSGPFIQEKEHAALYYTMPSQQQAMTVWAENNGADHMVPHICATAEESYEIGAIDSEVAAYVEDMTMKFILGVESTENFEAFHAGLRDCGIERALEIRQQQYQRYLQR